MWVSEVRLLLAREALVDIRVPFRMRVVRGGIIFRVFLVIDSLYLG